MLKHLQCFSVHQYLHISDKFGAQKRNVYVFFESYVQKGPLRENDLPCSDHLPFELLW